MDLKPYLFKNHFFSELYQFLWKYALLNFFHFKENASSVFTKFFDVSNTNLGTPLVILKVCFLMHLNEPFIISSLFLFKILRFKSLLQIGHIRNLTKSCFKDVSALIMVNKK